MVKKTVTIENLLVRGLIKKTTKVKVNLANLKENSQSQNAKLELVTIRKLIKEKLVKK